MSSEREPDFRLLRPVLLYGEEWLPVFCTGVFLSVIAHIVLITGPNLAALQVTVSVAGLAAMTLVAYSCCLVQAAGALARLSANGMLWVFALSAWTDCGVQLEAFVDVRYLGSGVTGAIEPARDYRLGRIAERM